MLSVDTGRKVEEREEGGILKHCSLGDLWKKNWVLEDKCGKKSHIAVVGTKPRISTMETLQEKEKNFFTFKVSQWNQTFYPK